MKAVFTWFVVSAFNLGGLGELRLKPAAANYTEMKSH
jgi:hypothetical protein